MTIILITALALLLIGIGSILAGEWYRENMNEPVVRGYIE